MMANDAGYPVRLEVDAAQPQGRLTVVFRLLLALPHAIILGFVGIAVGVVGILAWFAIVILGRYPAVLLRFAIGYHRWAARLNAYANLLTSRYPPFSLEEEAEYPVRLIVMEQSEGRSRLTTFFRLILLIPHAVLLGLLGIIMNFVMVAAWLMGILLGGLPEGLHGFIAGFSRWNERVNAYGSLLVDDYPPFSFE